MTTFQAVLLALVSGLGGAIFSTIIYIRREKRKFKIDTLKKFAANRFDIKGDEFTRALNEIFIVFNDSRNVMSALSDFHQNIVSKKPNQLCEDALVKLFKELCKDVKIRKNSFNDSFFLIPFNTKLSSMGIKQSKSE